ncbi:MAG TPA: hypothetical protein VN688_22140, partial [Gemmataceae bacterium]|nr:hypothetical protein [Gemmataceae bacterium]
MPSGPNLFARLHKWAARQDENFLTESLAVVLEQLLILAPEVGVRLVRQLTGGFIDLPQDEASAIIVRTQVEAGQGRPDLEFRAPYQLVWVEVKAESELRAGQLEGYRVLLRECGIEQTRLILLTRYPEVFQSEDARPDLEIRWFEFADWLEKELPDIETAGQVANFLARQFLDFLWGRNMNLTQVGKYMPDGLRALSSWLNMLREAAVTCKVKKIRVSDAWNYNGVSLEGGKYWIGFIHAAPEKLYFNTFSRMDTEAAARRGISLVKETRAFGGVSWSKSVELDSESIHFFSRSKVSQMEWLECFLRECLDIARSIETPDQPPIPEDPEE